MKIISMSELRKNIYAATRELPVEVQAKGKTLFYILDKPGEVNVIPPQQDDMYRAEDVRKMMRILFEELELAQSTRVPENKPRETGTMPVENTNITGTIPIDNIAGIPLNTPIMAVVRETQKPVIEPEALWEDYNLMPVYKTGEDDQFCTTWHQKGLRQRVYPIKKFRADGTLELEGKYCKDCIKEFLTKDGHLE